MLMVVVLRPAVELPVEQRDAVLDGPGAVVDQERRAGVAEPDAVGGRLDELDPPEVHPHLVQALGGSDLHLPPLDHDVDPLDPAQVPDDLGVDPGHRRELAGPVVAVVGPGDPGRLVRLPLGGHPISELGGRLGHHRGKGMETGDGHRDIGPGQVASRKRWVIGP